MRIIIIVFVGLVLFSGNRPGEKKIFKLSERQKQEGWYLKPVGNYMAKLMHPVYGYIKYVSLTAPEMHLDKLSKQTIQTIDLRDADTSLYSGMFVKKDFFPASGISGYPVQIGDFNHNNQLDFYGSYKWKQDYRLADGCVVEFENDSEFVLKKIYGDTLIEPLPFTDLNKDGFKEINFRQNRKFAQLRSTTIDSFPDSISFTYNMWPAGGGEVGAETLVDLDKDGNMDMIYVGDDTLEPAGKHKIFVAEYNKDIDNFEQKFRYFPEDYTTYGYSYGDFDNDGFYEFVTGSIHGDVYIFENSGNDQYGLINKDTLSTSNAYLTVATNDIDSNGKTEFFVGGSSYFNGIGGTRFYWFEADGDNSYTKVRSFFILGVDPLSWDEIHTFDVNNDGKDDILINYTYSVVILTWNNETQEFEIYYLSHWDHPVEGVTMYDLNNNSKLDFFISVKENENIPPLRTYYFKNKISTSITNQSTFLPIQFQLFQNYPNPFNIRTLIKFVTKQPVIITLSIFNILGKEVRTLIKNKAYRPGEHTVNWAGKDNKGKEVSTGLYIYVLSDGKQTISRKMLFIK
ncbi:MAG TPA: T9SS type A sorting domain-containing protein [Gammaproteobacteria bacterium]|nr:T9SS type A sorting domain-containing protein [Gammaproteobacteria bacterium]